MSAMPETGRLAGHVLLDIVVGWGAGGPGSDVPAVLAFKRLEDIGAMVLEKEPETGRDIVEMSPVLGGLAVIIGYLSKRLSLELEVSQEQVIAETRAFLDSP